MFPPHSFFLLFFLTFTIPKACVHNVNVRTPLTGLVQRQVSARATPRYFMVRVQYLFFFSFLLTPDTCKCNTYARTCRAMGQCATTTSCKDPFLDPLHIAGTCSVFPFFPHLSLPFLFPQAFEHNANPTIHRTTGRCAMATPCEDPPLKSLNATGASPLSFLFSHVYNALQCSTNATTQVMTDFTHDAHVTQVRSYPTFLRLKLPHSHLQCRQLQMVRPVLPHSFFCQ